MLSCSVLLVTNFQCHFHCIVDEAREFPCLKVNISQWLFLNFLMTSTCGRRARLRTLEQIGIWGYPLTLFALHTCEPQKNDYHWHGIREHFKDLNEESVYTQKEQSRINEHHFHVSWFKKVKNRNKTKMRNTWSKHPTCAI